MKSKIIIKTVLGLSFIYGSYYINENSLIYAMKDDVNVNKINRKFSYFLSDVIPVNCKVGWGSLKKDSNLEDKPISLKLNGENKNFSKGLTAHANAELIYDIDNLNCNIFEAYLGVDPTKAGDVEFKIYLDEKLEYSSERVTRDNTKHILLNIKNKKKLKIIIDSLGGNGSDHSILADAKFYNKDLTNFKMPDLSVSKLDFSFDKIMEKGYISNLDKHNFLMSINPVDIFTYLIEDEKNSEFLNWFTNDATMLHYYNTSGNPTGNNKIGFLTVLQKIVESDINAKTNPMNKKIAMAVALEYADQPISFWANKEAQSDPVKRYKIYRDLNNTPGELMPIFKTLNIELMRNVVSAEITDEDLIWIREKVKKEHPDLLENNERLSNIVYKYIAYNPFNKYGDNVQKDGYYGENPRLDKVVELGGVCGAVSKFDAAVLRAFGVPANVIGQPGHEAVTYLKDNSNWDRNNNISSWGLSKGGTVTLLAEDSSGYNTTYNILASNILKNKKNYDLANKYYESYKNITDEFDKIAIQEKILELVPQYTLVYRDKIKELKNKKDSTTEDYYELAHRILVNFKDYPKPMKDLLAPIKTELVKNRYLLAKFSAEYVETIDNVTNSIARDVLKEIEYQDEYKYYSTILGDFLFSKNGNTVLQGAEKDTEYSLDGGVSYISITEKNPELRKVDVDKITAANGILLRLKGTNSAIKLKFNTLPIPNVIANDVENRIIGLDDSMEYSLDNGNIWTDGSIIPALEGNKNVLVRYKKNEKNLGSDAKQLNFTETETKINTILQSNMSIAAVSSEQNKKNQAAVNAINGTGTANNFWHTAWHGDTNRYITIKFNKVYNLNKIKYTPRQDNSTNGNIKKYRILVSNDGKNFSAVKTGEIVYDNKTRKDEKVIDLPNNTSAEYVKIEVLEAEGQQIGFYAAATKFEFEIPEKEAEEARKVKKEEIKNSLMEKYKEEFESIGKNIEKLKKWNLYFDNKYTARITKLENKILNYNNSENLSDLLNESKKEYDSLRDNIILNMNIYLQSQNKAQNNIPENDKEIINKSLNDITDEDLELINNALNNLSSDNSKFKTELLMKKEKAVSDAELKKYRKNYSEVLNLKVDTAQSSDYNRVNLAYYNLEKLSSMSQKILNEEKHVLKSIIEKLENNNDRLDELAKIYKENNSKLLKVNMVNGIDEKNYLIYQELLTEATTQYSILSEKVQNKLSTEYDTLNGIKKKLNEFNYKDVKLDLEKMIAKAKEESISNEVLKKLLEEKVKKAEDIINISHNSDELSKANFNLFTVYEEVLRDKFVNKDNLERANKIKNNFKNLLSKNMTAVSIADKEELNKFLDQYRRLNDDTKSLVTNEKSIINELELKILSLESNSKEEINSKIQKFINSIKEDKKLTYNNFNEQQDEIIVKANELKGSTDTVDNIIKELLNLENSRDNILLENNKIKNKVDNIKLQIQQALNISIYNVLPKDKSIIENAKKIMDTVNDENVKNSLSKENTDISNLLNKISEIEKSGKLSNYEQLEINKKEAIAQINKLNQLSYSEKNRYIMEINKKNNKSSIDEQVRYAKVNNDNKENSTNKANIDLKNKIKSIVNSIKENELVDNNKESYLEIVNSLNNLEELNTQQLKVVLSEITLKIENLKQKNQTDENVMELKIKYSKLLSDVNSKKSKISKLIEKLSEDKKSVELEYLKVIEDRLILGNDYGSLNEILNSLEKKEQQLNSVINEVEKINIEKLNKK